MKKALIVAGTASMIQQFNLNNIEILEKLGYQVDITANFDFGSTFSLEKVKYFQNRLLNENKNVYNISFTRDLSDIKNMLKSYKQIKNLIETNQYTLIHCHMPICSAITRLACKHARTQEDLKVIYTAHGFHFYKGAPIQNILAYKTVEKWMARYTDALITINQEDYAVAKKFRFKQDGEAYYVPGIGIDTKRYQNIKVDKKEKRKELNISEDKFVILSVGELNDNKNHQIVLRALSICNNKKLVYLICGEGFLKTELKNLSKELMIENQVKLLGYRTDIIEIMKIADVFVHPSKREGLPVALMEAMACNLPIIASNVRGNTDLVENNINGFVCNVNKIETYVEALNLMYENKVLLKKMGENNLERIQAFDLHIVKKEMKKIYEINTK